MIKRLAFDSQTTFYLLSKLRFVRQLRSKIATVPLESIEIRRDPLTNGRHLSDRKIVFKF